MQKLLKKLEGRHIVFIFGFILMSITSIWNIPTSESIAWILLFIGVGIFLRDDD